MGNMDLEAQFLFSYVDDAIDNAPEAARWALLDILDKNPDNPRAQRLLQVVDLGFATRAPLKECMDAAESFAADGYHGDAKRLVDQIKKQSGHDPEVQAWLRGAHLLWEN